MGIAKRAQACATLETLETLLRWCDRVQPVPGHLRAVNLDFFGSWMRMSSLSKVEELRAGSVNEVRGSLADVRGSLPV